jgi:hypothetical protein
VKTAAHLKRVSVASKLWGFSIGADELSMVLLIFSLTIGKISTIDLVMGFSVMES